MLQRTHRNYYVGNVKFLKVPDSIRKVVVFEILECSKIEDNSVSACFYFLFLEVFFIADYISLYFIVILNYSFRKVPSYEGCLKIV